MSKQKRITIYAALKDDILVPLNDAEKGVRYTCLECSEDVIVRSGLKRIKHFSHLANSDCNGESILHLTAKRIIKDNNEIIIPPRGVNSFKYTKATEEYAFKSNNGTLRKVDVLVENAEEKLAIEIKVTHAVEEDKILDFRRRKLKAIEIDLSEYNFKELEFKTLSYYVLRDESNRRLLIPSEIKKTKKYSNLVQNKISSPKDLKNKTESSNRGFLGDLTYLKFRCSDFTADFGEKNEVSQFFGDLPISYVLYRGKHQMNILMDSKPEIRYQRFYKEINDYKFQNGQYKGKKLIYVALNDINFYIKRLNSLKTTTDQKKIDSMISVLIHIQMNNSIRIVYRDNEMKEFYQWESSRIKETYNSSYEFNPSANHNYDEEIITGWEYLAAIKKFPLSQESHKKATRKPKKYIIKKDNPELTPEDPIEEDFKPSYGGQDDSSITYTPPNGDGNW